MARVHPPSDLLRPRAEREGMLTECPVDGMAVRCDRLPALDPDLREARASVRISAQTEPTATTGPAWAPLVVHVDDSKDDLLFVARIHRLHARPSILVQFTSTEAALTFLRGSRPPNLVLLDYRVEDGNGLELLTRMRTYAHLATVPAYLLSGVLDPRLGQMAVAAGAKGFLLKPIDVDSLAGMLTPIFAACLSR